MDSLRSIFSEAAALAVGITGAAISAQGVFTAVDLLFAAGGIPPGLVTGMVGLVMVGTGAAAGGAIGYRGTMAVANELGEALGGPSASQQETTGPIGKGIAKALPEVAARSYLWPYRWPDMRL